MKLWFMPVSKAGKYSLWLIIIAIVLIGIVIAIGSGIEPPTLNEGFFSNLPLALLTLAAFISGTCSFVAGIVALIKNKDYSILVWVCLILGAFIIYFGSSQVVGEM
jgi:hypothetical protein